MFCAHSVRKRRQKAWPTERNSGLITDAHELVGVTPARPLRILSRVVFELRRLDTGALVHRYDTEGAALGFVRDVVRVAGHQQAASFALYEFELDSEDREQPVAEGADLVWRALQDRSTL